MSSFGEKLRKLRREAKVSQMHLAKKIGIGYKTIYLYESGKAVPSIDIAARVAKFFQVSADFLLFEDDENEQRVRDREMLEYLVKADQLQHAHKSILKEIIDSLLARERHGDKIESLQDDRPRHRGRKAA